MPSIRAFIVAVLLGAAAGAFAFLWTMLEESEGLVSQGGTSQGPIPLRAR
jgi:hypothetical protein